MRYKLNPDKPYNVNRFTLNEHHEIWDNYQPLFEKYGDQGVPVYKLHSVDHKYGKGSNQGNIKYFNYCVNRAYIIGSK